MEENKNTYGEENSPTLIGRKTREWFENFWYHYKWHTLAVLFIILVVSVCTFQMCEKESYDAYILYAGEHEIKKTSSSQDISPYVTTVSSLKRVTGDFNEDGETSVSLKDLFLLSDEEIKNAEAQQGYEVNYTLINENKRILSDTLLVSDYYLCFLSEDVYLENKIIDGVPLFENLEGYLTAETAATLYDESAVYLSSTEFYSLPGIKDLPDDTLIVLRRVSALSAHYNSEKSEEAFSCAKEIFEKIINYKK